MAMETEGVVGIEEVDQEAGIAGVETVVEGIVGDKTIAEAAAGVGTTGVGVHGTIAEMIVGPDMEIDGEEVDEEIEMVMEEEKHGVTEDIPQAAGLEVIPVDMTLIREMTGLTGEERVVFAQRVQSNLQELTGARKLIGKTRENRGIEGATGHLLEISNQKIWIQTHFGRILPVSCETFTCVHLVIPSALMIHEEEITS